MQLTPRAVNGNVEQNGMTYRRYRRILLFLQKKEFAATDEIHDGPPHNLPTQTCRSGCITGFCLFVLSKHS